jgi:mRNA interferase MazF
MTATVKRGDIYYADLSPVVGSEQGGIRPVIIIQNDVGNKYSPTVIVAAITSQINKAKLPTHVEISSEEYGLNKDSVVLLEQIRTLDKKRLKEKIGHMTDADMKKVEDFSKNITENCKCLNDQYLDTPRLVNKSAVCTHVYAQYENRVLDKPVVITSVGKCKRYESLNMTMVERLLDFSMREIVLIGSPEYVLETRSEFIELAGNLIKELNLKANIKTGNDPFFTSAYSPKALMQKKCKLKYELNVLLPYNQKELSVGSFNYHSSYFTDAFNIKSSDGSPVHTGCIAFGLERFVYAYLSQIGLDDIPVLK